MAMQVKVARGWNAGYVGERGDARNKEEASQHQADFNGHSEVKNHGEEKRAKQNRTIVIGVAPQGREGVSLTHIPSHKQQNRGERGERNIAGQGRSHQHHH